MSARRASQGAAPRQRLLFVHAHPDDETLATGLTMAAYASGRHEVHLLTCTLGEEGEVIPAALADLVAHRHDTLGAWRRQELRAAMSVLGVAHTVLGEDPARGIASRYRDSGMAGTASAEHPDAFVRADPGFAADMVAAHIRALRPDVVVTYDKEGGYGHPDHIQAHRLTMAAMSALAAEAEAQEGAPSNAPAESQAEPLRVPMAFCILTPQSWASQDRAWLQANVAPADGSSLVLPPDAPFPPSVVSEEAVTHVMEEPAYVELQAQALAKHASQVIVHKGYYVLSNRIAARLSGREAFAQFDPLAGQLMQAKPGASRHTGLLTRYHNESRDC